MDGAIQRLDNGRDRIAVVGTGVAGLSAAWLLSKHHNVTVYEKDYRSGGHCNTVEITGRDGLVSIDTGFPLGLWKDGY